jgi:prepilin-type N-terminal cleavage/methylation domain-containing protein
MRKNGFTLIELLVVIAVIGLLSSIVLVAFGPARKKSRDAKGESELNEIMKAFEMKYSDNNGAYPNISSTDVEIPHTGTTCTDTSLSPYLSPTPCYNGIRYYHWYNSGNNQQFCVYFNLEADTSKYFGCSQKGCKLDTSASNACGF